MPIPAINGPGVLFTRRVGGSGAQAAPRSGTGRKQTEQNSETKWCSPLLQCFFFPQALSVFSFFCIVYFEVPSLHLPPGRTCICMQASSQRRMGGALENAPSKSRVVDVLMGQQFTLLQTAAGVWYGVGYNEPGQLGLNSTASRVVPGLPLPAGNTHAQTLPKRGPDVP